ncbi:MAG TPA: hypothetical protein VFU49_09810 [Ktedonobacteraceae bacterium]|nr:hypothetical protein [Ktedonobacteraceae bacterium]
MQGVRVAGIATKKPGKTPGDRGSPGVTSGLVATRLIASGSPSAWPHPALKRTP